MILPNLSAYHTLENSQGTLDPLGLYTIADRLATRLAPDLRERMKHPRYLTAIAAGAIVCSVFDETELAADEISAPWQVYEWYVASGFVKQFEKENPQQLLGMPAREKATRAMKENLPLNANRYLKTPSVFGFHGVYRTLAKGIKVLDGNQIGEFGTELVDIWEKEQLLTGFRVGVRGTFGNDFRRKLEDAVKSGLKAGAVAKPWSWEFYTKLADVLAPKSPGKNEAALLYNRLLGNESDPRAELIRFLLSSKGKKAIQSGSEKNIHSCLLENRPHCSQLLRAIQSYEKVCRFLYNAFYEILQWMEKNQGKANVNQLSKLSHVVHACKGLRVSFRETDLLLADFSYESALFAENFLYLRESNKPQDWVKLLFDHHINVQKNKPPNGKAPWVLEHSSGNYLLNTNRPDSGQLTDEYVHQYRSLALQSFLKDLGKIQE